MPTSIPTKGSLEYFPIFRKRTLFEVVIHFFFFCLCLRLMLQWCLFGCYFSSATIIAGLCVRIYQDNVPARPQIGSRKLYLDGLHVLSEAAIRVVVMVTISLLVGLESHATSCGWRCSRLQTKWLRVKYLMVVKYFGKLDFHTPVVKIK